MRLKGSYSFFRRRRIERSHGSTIFSPTEEEIDEFAWHVTNTTRSRPLLNAIKKIFSDDREAYRRVFLAPRIVDKKLRAFHSAESSRSGRKTQYEDWRREIGCWKSKWKCTIILR